MDLWSWSLVVDASRSLLRQAVTIASARACARPKHRVVLLDPRGHAVQIPALTFLPRGFTRGRGVQRSCRSFLQWVRYYLGDLLFVLQKNLVILCLVDLFEERRSMGYIRVGPKFGDFAPWGGVMSDLDMSWDIGCI